LSDAYTRLEFFYTLYEALLQVGKVCLAQSFDVKLFSFFLFQGMKYLEKRGIIHRDLAARNVLGKLFSAHHAASFRGFLTDYF